MEFELTSEQTQFRDSIQRLVETRQLSPRGQTAADYAEAWHAFAALGLAGLCLPEAQGGFSGTGEDIALVAIELGRAPTIAPRIETAVIAAQLLCASVSPSLEALRRLFVEGEFQPAVAWGETSCSGSTEVQGVNATRAPEGWEISGRKIGIVGGETAGIVLVAAALPGGETGVFSVRTDHPAIQRCGYRLIDTTPVADMVFTSARLPADSLLLSGAAADNALSLALDTGIVALCAASLGGMSQAITLTIDHLKTRQQFGRALAEFQALQHQVADMFIAENDARSSLYAAVAALDAPAGVRQRAVSAAKVKVATTAKEITGQAVHLHGGIGFTTEYSVGHLFRRALVDEKLLGDVEFHLARFEALVSRATDNSDRRATAQRSVCDAK
jgi:alkylation response protein AidB-like acyl-CoA dehydrogenase